MESQIVNIKSINKGKKENYKFTKYCPKRYKNIESNSKACRRFRPAKIFLCNKLNCRKSLIACLYGHAYSKNGKHPSLYPECGKCRQYDNIIRPICERYKINYEKKIVKLPRRLNHNKKKNGMPKDFILPRRKPKNENLSKLSKRRKKKPILQLPVRRRRDKNGKKS